MTPGRLPERPGAVGVSAGAAGNAQSAAAAAGRAPDREAARGLWNGAGASGSSEPGVYLVPASARAPRIVPFPGRGIHCRLPPEIGLDIRQISSAARGTTARRSMSRSRATAGLIPACRDPASLAGLRRLTRGQRRYVNRSRPTRGSSRADAEPEVESIEGCRRPSDEPKRPPQPALDGRNRDRDLHTALLSPAPAHRTAGCGKADPAPDGPRSSTSAGTGRRTRVSSCHPGARPEGALRKDLERFRGPGVVRARVEARWST